MKAIIVATPLQLFNAIIIMRHFFPKEKCDLFVLNIACDMHPVIKNYQGLDLIEDIFYLDNLCKKSSRLGIVWDHLFTQKEHRQILKTVSNKQYDDMFTTWVGRASTWIFTKLSKNNPSLRVHFYEEGIGVYTKEIYGIYNGIKKMYKILRYKYEADYSKDVYVYQPAMCRSFHSQLQRIKIGDVTDEDIEYLGTALPISKIKPYLCQAVYFENDFRGTVFEGVDEEVIVETIANVIPYDKLIVRMHPRSPKDKYNNTPFVIDQNVGISWEDIIAVDYQHIEKTILISTISTAVFSPKLTYGKEPKVLMIGKAIKNEYKGEAWADAFWDDSIETFTMSFRNLYENKDNVQIPANFDEMKEALSKWIS